MDSTSFVLGPMVQMMDVLRAHNGSSSISRELIQLIRLPVFCILHLTRLSLRLLVHELPMEPPEVRELSSVIVLLLLLLLLLFPEALLDLLQAPIRLILDKPTPVTCLYISLSYDDIRGLFHVYLFDCLSSTLCLSLAPGQEHLTWIIIVAPFHVKIKGVIDCGNDHLALHPPCSEQIDQFGKAAMF